MDAVMPRPLHEGDKIAIIAPASAIDPAYVEGALPVLRSQGWNPYVSPSTLGCHGSYSAAAADRLADLVEAANDPDVRAILCARGGYGAVHLLEDFPEKELLSDPKWIIGFSDISALHARLSRMGVMSIHASMCKHLAIHGSEDECSASLFDILRGKRPVYSVDTHPFNHTGEAEGTLVGGNMAVLGGLIGTRFDIFATPDPVIFIEDIAEPIYKVERLLYQLRLNGTLHRARGLIIGQFTEYRPDRNYTGMYDMIHDMTEGLDMPVAFNFPVGHVERNLPLMESAPCRLSITQERVTLSQQF